MYLLLHHSKNAKDQDSFKRFFNEYCNCTFYHILLESKNWILQELILEISLSIRIFFEFPQKTGRVSRKTDRLNAMVASIRSFAN